MSSTTTPGPIRLTLAPQVVDGVTLLLEQGNRQVKRGIVKRGSESAATVGVYLEDTAGHAFLSVPGPPES